MIESLWLWPLLSIGLLLFALLISLWAAGDMTTIATDGDECLKNGQKKIA